VEQLAWGGGGMQEVGLLAIKRSHSCTLAVYARPVLQNSLLSLLLLLLLLLLAYRFVTEVVNTAPTSGRQEHLKMRARMLHKFLQPVNTEVGPVKRYAFEVVDCCFASVAVVTSWSRRWSPTCCCT
jgi:hypothetical protein